MLPMSHNRHGVPARGTSLYIDAVHFDVSASLVGDPESGVPFVERVVAAEVQGMPGLGERHPQWKLAVEAD